MVETEALEKLETRATEVDNLIALVRKEIGELSAVISAAQDSKKSQLLREANEKLEEEVSKTKEELINIQKKNGTEQVDVPTTKKKRKPKWGMHSDYDEVEFEAPVIASRSDSLPSGWEKSLEGHLNETVPSDSFVHIGRLDLRVGRIQHIEDHPEAENLYIETIDVGEEEPRSVISGLRKHIMKEDLLLRPVVVLCNLKPAKIRGIKSYGMLLCAVYENTVEPVWPAPNTVPGQRLRVAGFECEPDKVLNPKDKVFEKVARELKINEDRLLMYKDIIPVEVKDSGFVFTKKLHSCGVA